jgi:hypothetical protein
LEAAVREALCGLGGHHAVDIREVPEQFFVAGVDGCDEVAAARYARDELSAGQPPFADSRREVVTTDVRDTDIKGAVALEIK